MSGPEVSVVVPTKDRPELLPVTLRAVLGQADVDLEVVVVDDGSTRPARETVPEVRDPRVRVVRHERPRGMAGARNAGIEAGGGRWAAFCDDDDVWAPDKLARQLRAVAETGRSWVYAGVVDVDERLEVVAGLPPPSPETAVADLPRWDSIPAGASNVLARTDMVKAAGGFDPRFRHMADWALWLRLAREGPPACVSAPLVAYRLHPGAMSLDGRGLEAEIALLEEVAGAQVDRVAFRRWVATRNLQAGRWAAGALWLGRATAAGRLAPRSTWVNLRLLGGHLRAALPARSAGPRVHHDERLRAWQADADVWLEVLRSSCP